MAVYYSSGVLCTVGCKARKRHDKTGIESIIMAANIRQWQKRTDAYEVITSFFDEKDYGRRLLYTIGSLSDPA